MSTGGFSDPLEQADAVLVDDLDLVAGARHDEPLPHLVDALLHHVERVRLGQVRPPELVEHRQHEVGA